MSLIVPIAVAWLLALLLSAWSVGHDLRLELALAALALACCALLAAGAGARRWDLWGGVLSLATLLAGLSLGDAPQPRVAYPEAGLYRLRLRVQQVRHGPGNEASTRATVLEGSRVADHRPLLPGTRLLIGPRPLLEGSEVWLLAHVRPLTSFRNATARRQPRSSHPIDGLAWIPEVSPVRSVGISTPSLLVRLRQRVRTRLTKTLQPRTAGIARALILGDGRAVQTADRQAVRQAGLSHILAVSGLHVAIMSGVLVTLLRLLLLRCGWLARRFEARRLACLLGAPLALGVAAFAGGAPSAWRAAITAALGWLLVAAGRKPAPGPLTAAAGLAFTVAAPQDAARPGFLLSIVATAALVSAAPARRARFADRLLQAAVLSIRVTLATAPIVLWCFGSLPLIGVVANVVLAPAAAHVVIPLAALHSAVALVAPGAAGPTGWLMEHTSGAFIAACGWFGEAPGVDVPPLSPLQGTVLAVAALTLLALRSWPKRVWAAILATVVLFAFEVWQHHVGQPRDVLRVTFVDVGQGDAALIDLPDGRAMLIDAGGNPGGGPDPGTRALLPLLGERRRSRIDVVAITHPHPDHYGGLASLVDRIPIGELWDTGQGSAEQPDGEADKLFARARGRATRVIGPGELCDRPRQAGGARIEVLWPCPGYDPGLDLNDNSLVIRIAFGRHRFLFTGDIEREAEKALVRQGIDLRADVLKVPHHGSRTSTDPTFLAAVSPRLAVLSTGRGNRFGHPHAEVVQRLTAATRRLLRTDEDGGVVVTSDGNELRVRTWREQMGP
ncbi:MAG: DNA internalization-related competence protein ComEC/Rec2 [Proteobacteria bacterium]|nr:DNA internalization-related competence protein ComEC/Rec2 [Pseudomonadota bacterium]